MKNLAYWKAAVIDTRRMADERPCHEYMMAVIHAENKVLKLERIAGIKDLERSKK
jgi:hypothetical protein